MFKTELDVSPQDMLWFGRSEEWKHRIFLPFSTTTELRGKDRPNLLVAASSASESVSISVSVSVGTSGVPEIDPHD
jgi:hypothetical protein